MNGRKGEEYYIYTYPPLLANPNLHLAKLKGRLRSSSTTRVNSVEMARVVYRSWH
jgi:hypothetical protein